MSTITYNNQFSGVENLLKQIHYPFKGVKNYVSALCLSTILNLVLFFKVRKILKKIEKNGYSNDEFKAHLENVKKVRNLFYELDEAIEKLNVSKIVHYNIHSSLVKLDDLAEDIEICVDDEIQELGKKIARSL